MARKVRFEKYQRVKKVMAENPENKSEEKVEAKPAEAEKPAGDKPAPSAAKPAPKAAPKAKPKAEPKDPLIDNGDGTITDPNSGYMWKQSDAWLDCHKFFTFDAAKEYLDNLNKDKFAGYEDWRMPNKLEATTLVDKAKVKTQFCLDKNGTTFPLDPIFTEGRVCNTWITECTPEKVIRFDYKIGGEFIYPPSEVWSSIYAVRGEAKPAEVAKPAATPAEKPASSAGATAAASTKSD